MKNENRTSGTCQICGANHKAKHGLIAHHGYRRPYEGMQTSSCYGARSLPYEVSCNAIPGYIERLERCLENNEVRLIDLMKNPPMELTYFRLGDSKKVVRPEGFDADKCIDAYTFSAMSSRYEITFQNLIKSIKRDIQNIPKDIEYFKARIANWRES